jgi:hypothetical protein
VRIPPDNAIFVKRLTREVQILREIHHPNIVHLHKVPSPPMPWPPRPLFVCMVWVFVNMLVCVVVVGLVGVWSACMERMYVGVSLLLHEAPRTCVTCVTCV